MHFVICAFIALICLITAILFTEVFPKWFKAFLTLIGAGTSGYALAKSQSGQRLLLNRNYYQLLEFVLW